MISSLEISTSNPLYLARWVRSLNNKATKPSNVLVFLLCISIRHTLQYVCKPSDEWLSLLKKDTAKASPHFEHVLTPVSGRQVRWAALLAARHALHCVCFPNFPFFMLW